MHRTDSDRHRLLELAAQAGTHGRQADAVAVYRELAGKDLAAGALTDAAFCFAKALALEPGALDLRLALAELLELQDPARAEAHYRRLAKAVAGDLELVVLLRLTALAPLDAELRQRLADRLELRGFSAAASREWQGVADIHSTLGRSWPVPVGSVPTSPREASPVTVQLAADGRIAVYLRPLLARLGVRVRPIGDPRPTALVVRTRHDGTAELHRTDARRQQQWPPTAPLATIATAALSALAEQPSAVHTASSVLGARLTDLTAAHVALQSSHNALARELRLAQGQASALAMERDAERARAEALAARSLEQELDGAERDRRATAVRTRLERALAAEEHTSRSREGELRAALQRDLANAHLNQKVRLAAAEAAAAHLRRLGKQARAAVTTAHQEWQRRRAVEVRIAAAEDRAGAASAAAARLRRRQGWLLGRLRDRSRLGRRLEDARVRARAATTQLSQSTLQLGRLTRQLATEQERAQAAEAGLAAADRQRRAAEARLELAQHDQDQLRQRHAALAQERAQAEAHIDALSEQLIEAQQSVAELDRQAAATTVSLAQEQARGGVLANSLSRLQADLIATRADHVAARDRLVGERDHSRAESRRLQDQLVRLGHDLEISRSTAERIERDRRELAAEADAIAQRERATRDEIDRWQATARQTGAELEQLRAHQVQLLEATAARRRFHRRGAVAVAVVVAGVAIGLGWFGVDDRLPTAGGTPPVDTPLPVAADLGAAATASIATTEPVLAPIDIRAYARLELPSVRRRETNDYRLTAKLRQRDEVAAWFAYQAGLEGWSQERLRDELDRALQGEFDLGRTTYVDLVLDNLAMPASFDVNTMATSFRLRRGDRLLRGRISRWQRPTVANAQASESVRPSMSLRLEFPAPTTLPCTLEFLPPGSPGATLEWETR